MGDIGRNEKKGGNKSTELYNLQVLNKILTAIAGVGVPSTSGLALESTLQSVDARLISVINAIVASDQDIEILLVRDTGNGNKVVQQITDYQTGTPVISYKDVDGNPYVPTGPNEYLDPSAVLNLMLTQLTPALRTHNTVVATGAGSIPVGSIRGSVFNAGSAAGVWNGISLPTGVGVPWEEVGNRDTYAAIGYDATGTTFLIEYTM